MSGKNIWTTTNKNGGWDVRVEGSSRVSRHFETKVEAMEYGRGRAIKNSSEHFIQNKNGRIGSRNSYGNDPHPPRG